MNKTTRLIDIVDKGSEIDTLLVLRRKIAKTIDESKSGRDIASLSRQLREINGQITELQETRREGETVLDEIIRKHNGNERAGFYDEIV